MPTIFGFERGRQFPQRENLQNYFVHTFLHLLSFISRRSGNMENPASVLSVSWVSNSNMRPPWIQNPGPTQSAQGGTRNLDIEPLGGLMSQCHRLRMSPPGEEIISKTWSNPRFNLLDMIPQILFLTKMSKNCRPFICYFNGFDVFELQKFNLVFNSRVVSWKFEGHAMLQCAHFRWKYSSKALEIIRSWGKSPDSYQLKIVGYKLQARLICSEISVDPCSLWLWRLDAWLWATKEGSQGGRWCGFSKSASLCVCDKGS